MAQAANPSVVNVRLALSFFQQICYPNAQCFRQLPGGFRLEFLPGSDSLRRPKGNMGLLQHICKVHALLCRQYLKGRDWFDFVWYVGERVKVNHALLSSALDQLGPWAGQGVTTDNQWVREQLRQVIGRIDWAEARRDVLPFVYATDRPSVDLWSEAYFANLLGRF